MGPEHAIYSVRTFIFIVVAVINFCKQELMREIKQYDINSLNFTLFFTRYIIWYNILLEIFVQEPVLWNKKINYTSNILVRTQIGF